LRFERYLAAFTIIREVFAKRFHSLVCSFYLLLLCTIVFSFLLHETEKSNQATTGPVHMTMAHRFRSVPSSFFYTFIHLTGDYPLYQYTPWGKVVNFFMIIIAQGLVAIPLGIIVEGFQAVVEERVEKGEQLRESLERNAAEAGDGAHTEPTVGSGSGSGVEMRGDPGLDSLSIDPSKQAVYSTLNRHWKAFSIMDGINAGELFNLVQIICCLLSVLCLAVHTSQGAKGSATASSFEAINYAVSSIFALEYALRLYSCPADPKFRGGDAAEYSGTTWKDWASTPGGFYFCYATDFTGVVDLLAWLPFFLAQGYAVGSDAHLVFLSLQLVCILKFDRLLPAFTLLDDVMASGETGRLLLCTTLLSMIIWVVFAALFFVTEQGRKEMGPSMTTMPHALFTTMIFIGGEWMSVDLQEPWGEVAGAILAVLGLGVVGIPISIIFEGYSEISEKYVEKYITDGGEDDAKGMSQAVLTSGKAKAPELEVLKPGEISGSSTPRAETCSSNCFGKGGY